jgi:hypothetical protein
MNNTMRFKTTSRLAAAVFAATTLLAFTGCKKTVDDGTLTTNVKAALSADQVIAHQPVQVAVQNGVVTLTGNVTDETASMVAAQDSSQVTGVKEVVNSLTVAGLAVTPTITTPVTTQTTNVQSTASKLVGPAPTRPATLGERVAIKQHQPLPPPPENAPPPPPPPVHTVTVPVGYDVRIRITESFDSATAEPGTPFSGVVLRPVVVNGYVAIPAGASVYGTLTDAKDATHFKGSSLLVLRLDSIRRHGERISVSAEPYVVQGKGRGVNSAEKIGGGAAVGAILGGIFGGGKGAAIGAAAGGGGGAALQGFTKGQQVSIPSETVLPFHLTAPITVQTSEQAEPDAGEPGLQQR